MNAGFALYYHCCSEPRNKNIAFAWYAVAAVFGLHAIAYFLGAGWTIPCRCGSSSMT